MKSDYDAAMKLASDLDRAKGSAILPKVYLGMFDAEQQCLKAAEMIKSQADEIVRLNNFIADMFAGPSIVTMSYPDPQHLHLTRDMWEACPTCNPGFGSGHVQID